MHSVFGHLDGDEIAHVRGTRARSRVHPAVVLHGSGGRHHTSGFVGLQMYCQGTSAVALYRKYVGFCGARLRDRGTRGSKIRDRKTQVRELKK